MVNESTKNGLAKYKEIIFNEKEEQISQEIESSSKEYDSVILFFSFDIVNSSAYKTINYYGWSIVLHEIIRKIQDRVKEKITSAEVWRVLGDEVIFIVNIYDTDSMFVYIDYIYEILITFCKSMDDDSFFEGLSELSPQSINLMKLQNIVSLQATAWIAVVTDQKKASEAGVSVYAENIFEVFEEKRNNIFYEFIGQDIDTGFRLSKQTRERRLTLSFELAYLLARQQEYAKRLHVITYRRIKGVWDDKWYPVIWYYNPKINEDRTFIRSFPFDSVEQDSIYKEFFGKKPFPEYMYKDTKSALRKIAFDRKLQYKINRIENVIKESGDRVESYLNDSRLELHCVAVCFDKNNNAFIAKRHNRKFLDNCWECGCAQASSKKTLTESLQEDYKKDFGITIEPLVYESRVDKEPIPVVMYKIEKGGELHKGIVTLAKIVEGEIKIKQEKHSEYKMISEENIDTLEEDECVPDLKSTLQLAFAKYKELEGE